MSSDRTQEAYPLMDNTRPTAPTAPGYSPPPYSSLFGTQSQAYTPVPAPAPMQPPYPTESTSAQAPYPTMSMPMPMPISQTTAPYPMADRKAMPLPVYAPTTYDPMTSEQPVSANQIVVISSSRNREPRKSRCLPLKIIAVIIIISLAGFGLAMRRKIKARQREIDESRRYNHDIHSDYSQWPGQRYNERYRRMVRDEQPHSKEYGFSDLNDNHSFGKSIKSEKLHRKKRSFKIKDSFRKNKNGRSYQKKVKCYHR